MFNAKRARPRDGHATAYEELEKLMFKRWRLAIALLGLLCGLAVPMAARTGWAQSRAGELWGDTRTGQVFIRPGPHRVRLNLPGTVTEDQLNREVDERVQEKTQALRTQLNQQ